MVFLESDALTQAYDQFFRLPADTPDSELCSSEMGIAYSTTTFPLNVVPALQLLTKEILLASSSSCTCLVDRLCRTRPRQGRVTVKSDIQNRRNKDDRPSEVFEVPLEYFKSSSSLACEDLTAEDSPLSVHISTNSKHQPGRAVRRP